MSDTFSIAIEPHRKLLRVTLVGFLSRDDVAAYLVAKNAALVQLGAGPNQHVTLCDVSKSTLQSQEVALEFQKSISDPRHMSRRIAFVTGSSLARMQVQRLLTRAGGACFDTIAEAEAWLFRSDDELAHPHRTLRHAP